MNVVHGRLFDRIDRVQPRVLRMSASPGWGKTTFGQALAARSKAGVFCSFADVPDEADARKRLGANLERWAAGTIDVLVLDDVEKLGGDSELLDEVLSRMPPAKLLVLTATLGFVVDVARYVGPHEILTFTRDELALTDAERRAFIGEVPLPRDQLDRAADLSAGWFIAVLLFRRLAREGVLGKALDDVGGPLYDDLHEYMAFTLFRETTARELDALTVCAVLHGATSDDLSAALGIDAAPILSELTRRLMSLVNDNDVYKVSPLIAGALRRKRANEARILLRAGAVRLIERGALLRAAEFAIAADDEALAADALDRIEPPVVLAPYIRYIAIARKLSIGVLFRTRWPFVLVFASRPAAAYSEVLRDLVVSYCTRLSPEIDEGTRYTADIALAVISSLTFTSREAEANLRKQYALRSKYPGQPERGYLLAAMLSLLAATDGRFRESATYGESAHFDRSDLELAFRFIKMNIAFSRHIYEGQAAELFALQERDVECARYYDDPVVLAHAFAGSAIATFLFKPDTPIGDVIKLAEGTLPGDASANSRRFHARYVRPFHSSGSPTHFNCIVAIDAAFSQTDIELARRLVEVAVDGFDRIGLPDGRILGRIAASLIPGNNAERYLREAAALGHTTEAKRLQAELDALVVGREIDGPFSAVRKRLKAQPLVHATTVIRVQLVSESVDRGGTPIALRPREYAVLAALAIARTPIPVETFLDEFWSGSDAKSATRALRMTVYRLRKALGEADTIENVAGGYRLADRVSVDITDAECQVAALGRLPALTERDRRGLEALFTTLLAERLPARLVTKWSRELIVTIDDLRHRVGILLGEDDLRERKAKRAIETVETLLRFDALDEPAVELLVRALIASGNAAEAHHRYRRYADALAAEYEAEPTFSIESILVEQSA